MAAITTSIKHSAGGASQYKKLEEAVGNTRDKDGRRGRRRKERERMKEEGKIDDIITYTENPK